MQYIIVTTLTTHPSFDKNAGAFHRNPPSFTREGLDANTVIDIVIRKQHQIYIYPNLQRKDKTIPIVYI